MNPPARRRDKTQAAEDALLALASQESWDSTRSLLDHEISIFKESHAQLCNQPQFPETRIRVLRTALWNKNYAFVSKLLAKDDQSLQCLHGQLEVMKDAILHKVPTGRWQSRQRELDALPDIISLLLKHGAPAALADEHGECPLYYACKRGYFRTFQLLVEAGADLRRKISVPVDRKAEETPKINDLEKSNMNLLQVAWREWGQSTKDTVGSRDDPTAFEMGHGQIILRLLDFGLIEDPTDPVVIAVYHMLCLHGDLDRVQTLTEFGVRVHAQGLPQDRGDSVFAVTYALQAAAVGCHPEVVGFLLEHGASPRLEGPIYTPERWSRSSLQYDFKTPVTPLKAALYLYYESTRVHTICELLRNAGLDEDDLHSLLYFSIGRNWSQMVKDLLKSGVRIASVPLCLNIPMIDLLVRYKTPMNGRRFLQYVLNRGSLELLQYLYEEHGVRLAMHDYSHVALGLMRRYHYRHLGSKKEDASRHIKVLKYLMTRLSLSVNSVIRMGRREDVDLEFDGWYEFHGDSHFLTCELESVEMDAYPPISIGDDIGDPGEQTSLMRLACEWELYPAVEWLLEDENADITCPGLPQTALEYYIERPPLESRLMGDDLDERLVLLLLERSDREEIKDWKARLSTSIAKKTEEIEQCTKWRYPVSPPDSNQPNPLEDADALADADAALVRQSNTFPYNDLRGETAIRLFHLDPATSSSETITGTLAQYEPLDCPPFEALSYVWGEMIDLVPISLNGSDLQITKNLAAAITRLRESGCSRTLWIDAICINQQDLQEKNHQVSMMGNIYRRAQKVLIWLGEHASNSQLVFRWHEEHEEQIGADTEKLKEVVSTPEIYYTGETQAAFVALCKRPYWFRTWILQEVALSANAAVLCGSDGVDLQKFIRFNKDDYGTSDYHPLRGPDAIGHAKSISLLGMRHDLSHVATMVRHCHCQNPRDKVFGILGLLDNPDIVHVQYDAPVEEIYRDFTQAIIEERGDLAVLHWLGPNRSLHSLPSWVPDWSISKPFGVLRRSYGVFGAERLRWERKEDTSFSFADGDLKLKGVHIDTVRVVGGVLSAPDSSSQIGSSFNAVIHRWERLVFSEMQKGGVQALISFARTLHAEDDYLYNRKLGGRLLLYFGMWYQHHGTGFLRAEAPHAFRLIELAMAILSQIQDWTDFELSTQEKILRYTENMEVSCYGRQLYVTEKGSMGLGPPRAEVGDDIVFFPGGAYPFVVRKRDDEEKTWKVVGDCHMEDLDIDTLQALPLEDFTLR